MGSTAEKGNVPHGGEVLLSPDILRLRWQVMSLADLRKLPVIEKLPIIETLWNDLAADSDSLTSPAWHEAQLRQTEAECATGQIKVLDWKQAKEEHRKRFE